MKKFYQYVTNGNRPAVITCVIYSFAWILIVSSAWAIGLHRYDLSKTISAYIAFRKWTAVFYFVCATIMFLLLVTYVHKLEMPLIKKIVYYIVFLSVWGCSIFPSNKEWSVFVTSIHLKCSYGLMFSASFSFLLTSFFAKRRGQRIFAIATFVYALFFIFALLVMKWPWFEETIFIWENLCIYLILVELFLEAPRAPKKKSQ